jgi:hypothetical protein
VAESSHREFYSAAHGGRNYLILVGDIDQNQHQPPQLLGWGAGDRANGGIGDEQWFCFELIALIADRPTSFVNGEP